MRFPSSGRSSGRSLGTWLGTLLIVAGVGGACILSARASATVSECGAAAASVSDPAHTVPLFVRAADGSYTLSRAALERTLADPSALAESVRFAPAMKGKRVLGYRAVQVAPASPLHGILRQGDLVERINGVSLADGQASLALLSKAKDQRAFTLEGTRKGAPLSVVVRIAD